MREIRVTFAADTARTWGWRAAARPYDPRRYTWYAYFDGMDGLRVLELSVGSGYDDPAPRTFPSLAALVAAGRPGLCRTGMFWQCEPAGTRARVENGRVVLALRDSARIARLLALRPARIALRSSVPDGAFRADADSVPVEYVAPQIPAPTPATHAAAAAGRRRHLASITSMRRGIATRDGRLIFDTLWLAVRDTTTLVVREWRCTHDVCGTSFFGMRDSGWTVDDRDVARLLAPPAPSPDAARLGEAVVRLLPLTPGRTVVRVRGVHGPGDTVTANGPPPRALALPVRVVPDVGRVEITPRPTTMRQGERATFRVRAYTRAGEPIDDAPTELLHVRGASGSTQRANPGVAVTFDSAGTQLLVGRFLGRADTLIVRMTAAPPP